VAQKYVLLLAWIVSIVATLGSLFFSLVMKLPPCDFCWYQRIAMYPLIVVLGVAIAFKEKGARIQPLY